jgi:hypothetical protein
MKFQKGHKMSKEMRAKISSSLKGHKKSPETVAKMRISGKLNNQKISLAGRRSQADKIRGRKASPETRLKMSLMRRKDKHPQWKGGITPVVMQIRNSLKMRQWVSDIFHRDDFTCQECFIRGSKLNAHHIKSFSKIYSDNNIKNLEEALDCAELWDLNNGQTLCVECHKKINTRRDG